VKLFPMIVCRHGFGTSVRIAAKVNPLLYKKLNYHNAKNQALLLSVYRKLLPEIYAIQVLKYLLRVPIIEVTHFLSILNHNFNSDFIGSYYPLKSLTYVKYSMKKLSTINEYGAYIPLSLKIKDSKRLSFNPLYIQFNPLFSIRVDYEKMVVNDDIARSTRKLL